jgi:hypothetical protein
VRGQGQFKRGGCRKAKNSARNFVYLGTAEAVPCPKPTGPKYGANALQRRCKCWECRGPWSSLDCARDFASGLRRPLNASTSTAHLDSQSESRCSAQDDNEEGVLAK